MGSSAIAGGALLESESELIVGDLPPKIILTRRIAPNRTSLGHYFLEETFGEPTTAAPGEEGSPFIYVATEWLRCVPSRPRAFWAHRDRANREILI